MGRPRQLLMTRLFHRPDSAATLDDTATQCTLGHARKQSFDTASVTSHSERSLPQHLFESERSCCNETYCSESVGSISRRVGFGTVEIRHYEEVVGDHPFCASGCPLSLGWDYVQQEPELLAEYEATKEHTRHQDQLRLSDEQRRERLVANNVSDSEIRRCLRRLHRERECSVRCHTKAKAQFFM